MKKWIIILAALAMTLSACSKASLDKDPVHADWLIGSWYEYYDPNVFAYDGGSEVTFSADGFALWHFYGFLSGVSSNLNYRYSLNQNILTLIPENEEDEEEEFEVILLNRDEMAWQRVGTTYSVGTWASDYKHFKRSKN